MAPSAPSPSQLLADARTYKTVVGFLGAVGGGLVLSGYNLLSMPTLAGAEGMYNLIFGYLDGLAFSMEKIARIPGELVDAGITSTTEWILNNTGLAGIIIAFGVFAVLATLWPILQDLGDWDIPFFGQIPLIGPDEED